MQYVAWFYDGMPLPYTETDITHLNITSAPPEVWDGPRRLRQSVAVMASIIGRVRLDLIFSNTYQKVSSFNDPSGENMEVGALDFSPVPLKQSLVDGIISLAAGLVDSGAVSSHLAAGKGMPLPVRTYSRPNPGFISYLPAEGISYIRGATIETGITTEPEVTAPQQAVLSFIGVSRANVRTTLRTAGAEIIRNRMAIEVPTKTGGISNRNSLPIENAIAGSVGHMTCALALGRPYEAYTQYMEKVAVREPSPSWSHEGHHFSVPYLVFPAGIYSQLADGAPRIDFASFEPE